MSVLPFPCNMNPAALFKDGSYPNDSETDSIEGFVNPLFFDLQVSIENEDSERALKILNDRKFKYNGTIFQPLVFCVTNLKIHTFMVIAGHPKLIPELDALFKTTDRLICSNLILCIAKYNIENTIRSAHRIKSSVSLRFAFALLSLLQSDMIEHLVSKFPAFFEENESVLLAQAMRWTTEVNPYFFLFACRHSMQKGYDIRSAFFYYRPIFGWTKNLVLLLVENGILTLDMLKTDNYFSPLVIESGIFPLF